MTQTTVHATSTGAGRGRYPRAGVRMACLGLGLAVALAAPGAAGLTLRMVGEKPRRRMSISAPVGKGIVATPGDGFPPADGLKIE